MNYFLVPMKRSTQMIIFCISACAYLTYLGFFRTKGVKPIVLENMPPISYRDQTEKRLDSLVVNPDDNYRIIVKKSETDGLKDLQSLVSNAAYAEIWMYTPENSTWFEVGISASNRRLNPDGFYIVSREPSPSMSQASDYVSELMRTYDELVMYHIFPLVEQEVVELAGSNDPATIREARKTLQVIKALPSKSVLGSMVSLASKFYPERPSGKLSFRMITPLGIVEYDFTEKGKDLMITHDSNALSGFNLAKPVVDMVNDPIDKIHEIFDKANKEQDIFRFYFQPYN